jgi:two-component system phosphate regulon sensor histidine kinase PhoR
VECVDKQRQRAEKRGIAFQIMIPEGLYVYANRDAMIHIVGNLVENGVKYNRDDGLVTIRAERRTEPSKVLLEVIDLGIGMAPSHLDRIFERFFRVDKGRTQKVGGTGLGLSIVKRLVDRMGAHIEVRSRVDRGSIFRLWLDPE